MDERYPRRRYEDLRKKKDSGIPLDFGALTTEELRELRRGASIEEIAQLYDVSLTAVLRKEAGLTTKTEIEQLMESTVEYFEWARSKTLPEGTLYNALKARKEAGEKLNWREITEEELFTLREEATCKQIGDLFGVCAGTVTRKCTEYGINMHGVFVAGVLATFRRKLKETGDSCP